MGNAEECHGGRRVISIASHSAVRVDFSPCGSAALGQRRTLEYPLSPHLE